MINFDAKDIKLVTLVANHKNLKPAADRLFMTVSAASLRIKKLEELFGVKLFDRHPHSIELSEAGKRFYDYAKSILVQYEALERQMAMVNQKNDETVRLYTNYSGMVGGLQIHIGSFLEKNPSINVDFNLSQSAQIVDAVLDGEADIGIVNYTKPVEGVKFVPYFKDSFVLVTGLNNPNAAHFRNPISIGDLGNFPLVALNREMTVQEFFEQRIKEEGHKINIRARFPNMHASLETMQEINGGMLALKSSYIAKTIGLTYFELAEKWRELDIRICISTDQKRVSQNTRKLIAHLLMKSRQEFSFETGD